MTTKRILARALAPLALVAGAAAQEPEQRTQEGAAGPPLVRLAELELAHYAPRTLRSAELAQVVSRLVGREIYVEERGGYGSEGVRNVTTVGDRVVVYDTAAYVAKVLETLRELDQAGTGHAPAEAVTETVALRYVDPGEAHAALVSFLQADERGRPNVSVLPEQRLLVLRDTPERVARMRSVLERVDRPAEEALVRCWFLRGTEGGPGGGTDAGRAPAELLEHLRVLVPGLAFQEVGTALLRTAVVPGRKVQIETAGADGLAFEVSFHPVAYDGDTGTLTVRECRVQTTQPGAAPGRLYADAVLRGGEYTVLGASGADPVFVVVQVTPAP